MKTQATSPVPEVTVDFLLAYGNNTWEIKRHKIRVAAAELKDAHGAWDLRCLDPHIERLLKEVYAAEDIVAMVPYWIGTGYPSGIDASCGAPAPRDLSDMGATSLTPLTDAEWAAQGALSCTCSTATVRECACKGACICHYPH